MQHKPLIVLVCILILLVGFDYLKAWTAPSLPPPEANVAAPINTGADSQDKLGGMTVGPLGVFGDAYFGGVIQATSSVWAAAYCDRTGANCFVPGATTETNNEIAVGGNEMVYLDAPDLIFAKENFRPVTRKNLNLAQQGYPSNIVRLYVSSVGKSYYYYYKSSDGDVTQNSTTYSVDYYIPVLDTRERLFTFGSTGTQSGWIPINKGQVDFNIACTGYTSQCGVTASYADLSIVGYECSGACVYSAIELCTINFSYSIQGTTGSATREVTGGGGQMGIGLWNHHDDNISYNLPFTEQLASKSWGGSVFDSSEKAGVGYFDKNQYARNLALLQSRDSSSNYETKSLNLTVGSSASISSDAVKDIYAGTASMVATVVSCRTVGG